MLLRGFRYVQVLLLLCAVCCLSLAFPTQTPSAYDDVHSLQVTIPHSRQIFVPLGTSISIPCLVSLSSTPTTASSSSSPVVPRVKWTVVSNGVETQILVARGQRVKVNEAYRDRAALLNYTATPDDVSLWLGDLRSSDSGHYRCEVQQGLEDASDLVQLKVKGVVFHYRDALGRYTFSFLQAQRACESIGAEVATADQLLAAYYDGYEQCDAGWLADQSVRYPIQVPREACYGDMDGQPGVRNYGTMDPDDLFDVYCYVEQVDGEVFHDFVPQQLTFDEAQSYCRAAGAELATTAQLYAAWSEGLDRCSPGWLSDGSVRYPIITPRERCGGPQPGVKTVYRFSNQTGFPEPSSLHDVYCFKDHRITPTDIPMDYMATESESIDQDVVILREADEELHLNQHEDQVEREVLSELESFPIVSRPSETYNVPQNTSLLPSVNNETDSHQNLNDTSHHFEPANTTGLPKLSYEPFTDSKPETQPSERPKDSQETNFVLNKTLANYNETDSNHTQEENILKATVITPDIMMQVELEETAVTRPVPVSTDSPREEGEHQTLTTQAPIKTETSLFLPLDGSGDVSQESDIESVGDITTSESSTSDFTTQLPSSASPSSTTAGDGTALPDPTSSSGSQNTDKLGLDVFSTSSAQLWESSISKQEGSTSLESEDKVSTESGEQLHLTTVETDLVSGVSLAATESPEGSRTPQLPTHFTTAQFQTSGYRVYLETATTAYEEASGQEPDTFTAILGEDVKIAPTPEENVTVIPILKEEIKISPTVKEEAKPEHEVQVSPTLEDGITVTPNLEDGITVTPNLEYGITVTPNLEDGITVTPNLEDGITVTPNLEYGITVTPNLEDGITVTPSFEEEVTVVTVAAIHEERTTVAPMLEEVKIAPTIEEKVISSTLDEEEENGTSTTEEDDNVSSTIEEEANFASTIEEEANVTSTIEEEASVASTIEKEANVSLIIEEVNVTPTVEAEATDSTPIEEDANFSSTSGEEVKFAPTIEGDLTISPFDSQTSNLPLLTTTTEPQESLNDLEYDRKTSSITSTAAPDSPSSTKHSVATTQTITDTTKTTTHWSRRTWSPTTSTPRVFHKTTEPQKVTHLIPPVDQGLVDVEFSLTQPPTLLIMPNERAAVGGTGKVSDACLDDPCLNGGTCTDQDGQIKCLCLPTYGGDFCQTDLERCETGWDKFQGFCYRHFSQRLSWEVAEQHCRMQGAHLVSIMTPEEQSYINSNYKEYQWTGLNDKTIEDDFRWSDGNPLLYENWYKGQPDSYFLSGEDCVVMVWHDDGRWSDVPCNYHLAYTCKKGTSSCGPPPKVRNTSTFGKTRQRYETNAVIRYHCAKGFQQRLNPVIRCLSGGVWERPQIQCIPEGGGPTQNPEVTSPTDDNFAAAEDDFEATKAKPQYWDIKF